MPIDRIPDWEKRLARQDAFWSCEVIDRPAVDITVESRNPDYPFPDRKYDSLRARWLDADGRAETALAEAMNREYFGDALPHIYPNLGPEIFSAFFGSELEFGEETSWSVPIIEDWARDRQKIEFSEDNPYWRKTIELTDAFLAVGKGKFYTGITDMHPGGDAVAAFRDPTQLNYDMIEAPEQVRSILPYITEVYLRVYDFFYEKLRAAGQPISTWGGIVSSKKWLIPSNDFSCMISSEMFDDMFLPAIAEECRHYEASIYHLDGPGALKHLDSLLAIAELSAIQWVPGSGGGRASDWMPVYTKCQAAGKGLEIMLEPDELDVLMDNLRPEGLWLAITGITDRDDAEAVLKKIGAWRTRP